MTEEEKAAAEQAATAAKFGGGAALAALDASTRQTAAAGAGTMKSMGGVQKAAAVTTMSNDEVTDATDELLEYTNKPALKAINTCVAPARRRVWVHVHGVADAMCATRLRSARWSIKAAETAVDAVITEMNQRLPSVAEALVTLKAFRFLEVRLSSLSRLKRWAPPHPAACWHAVNRSCATTTHHWTCAGRPYSW